MRFGVASLFSFRPHVEHLAYLAMILARAGHTVCGFTCDAGVPQCYSRALRGRSKWRECPTCIVGGIRSYPIPKVWSARATDREPITPDLMRRLTLSSVATVFRTEATADLKIPEIEARRKEFERPVEIIYGSAKRWIERLRLEAVLLFNGRMDLTAGLKLACESSGIPYISVERSWFGHGLKLIPNENCLGLRELHRLVEEFREKPLLRAQALYAGRIAADRFRQQNHLEWRVYNPRSSPANWPGARHGGPRILILPSSQNEFEAHPDYDCGWSDKAYGIERALSYLGLELEHCVLRCHPNWGENIGKNTGWRSERYWTAWANRQGITVVSSKDRSNTYDLIDSAEYVVVNGSSAGVEAGLRGKKVLCIGHSTYDRAGFSAQIPGPEHLSELGKFSGHDPENVVRKALRYVYTNGRRFTQFVNYVRAITTLRYEYFDGADAERIVRMCNTGRIEPDDDHTAQTLGEESGVISKVLKGDWETLGGWEEKIPDGERLDVHRRAALRWVDVVRDWFPRGDL